MLKKAKFLAKEATLRVRYIMDKDCIFCKIVAGEIKSKLLFESETVIAFFDINPVTDVHILIVPKKHISSVLTIEKADCGEIVDMFGVASKLASDMKLESFRLAFNAGKFQHVPHLHMHLLAGSKIEWKKL